MQSNPTITLAQRRFTANAAAAAALLVCAALVVFPPARFSFYPQCPIHQYLGLLCPGCGATRALAALLHGHLQEALRQNALFVALLPFALFVMLRAYRDAVSKREFHWPRVPTSALAATLLLTAAFTIFRNLH